MIHPCRAVHKVESSQVTPASTLQRRQPSRPHMDTDGVVDINGMTGASHAHKFRHVSEPTIPRNPTHRQFAVQNNAALNKTSYKCWSSERIATQVLFSTRQLTVQAGARNDCTGRHTSCEPSVHVQIAALHKS
mmetsp:Transcript_27258/g.73268  ORF Transcript_27258/g.73268 Transcript_27258/m.73268 type:complete len:133 (+) Transcript_27258:130-528(+)